MRAGLYSKENSFCARALTHKCKERLAEEQGEVLRRALRDTAGHQGPRRRMPVPDSTDLTCLRTPRNLFLLQQSRWCPVSEVQHEHGACGERLLWPFVGDVHSQDLCLVTLVCSAQTTAVF